MYMGNCRWNFRQHQLVRDKFWLRNYRLISSFCPKWFDTGNEKSIITSIIAALAILSKFLNELMADSKGDSHIFVISNIWAVSGLLKIASHLLRILQMLACTTNFHLVASSPNLWVPSPRNMFPMLNWMLSRVSTRTALVFSWVRSELSSLFSHF